MAIEKISNPPHYVVIVPGTFSCWKAPPVAQVALFDPHERFIKNENQTAQEALFSFEKKNLIRIVNPNDEVVTNYTDTTLGSSQLVSNRLIREVNQKQTKDYITVDTK